MRKELSIPQHRCLKRDLLLETHQFKKWDLCEIQSETKTLSAFWCTCSAPLVHVTAIRLFFFVSIPTTSVASNY